jgi:hypothetical protein
VETGHVRELPHLVTETGKTEPGDESHEAQKRKMGTVASPPGDSSLGTTWPQYKLDNERSQCVNESFNFNSILCICLFCERQGKCSEILYAQLFSDERHVSLQGKTLMLVQRPWEIL